MTTLQSIYRHPLLKPEELQAIVDAHEKTVYRKGDYFLKKGQTANEYYCLEKGLVRSYVIDFSGREITTGFIGENEIIIDVMSLFQRIPSSENIQALTDCVCYRIDFETFQQLYHSIHGFSEWGRAWMSESLFRLKQRSISMITDSASERYQALIRQHPEILKHAPLKHIATYLGITDTSLSRIRKDFVSSNVGT
ncbi:MAG: Crp/Fnr family transcriptional regulator [Cyclobacteriaceae bacterium]|nr:Crp/Fnr family transcriptional regulator [Cyclobacteriaceae bacterium]